MSDLDAELGALIARAKEDGPAPARLEAVRARLEARIGPLDAVAAPPAPPPARGSGALFGKVAIGLAGIALLVAIGARLASRGPEVVDTRREAAPEVVRSTTPAEPRSPADEQIEAPALAPAAIEHEQPAAEAVPLVAPPPRRAAERVRAPVPEAAPSLEPEPDPASASSLREEIALLDRAIRARDAGDPAAAIAVLEQHRARFPHGHLQPERDRMLAELAPSGDPSATP